MAGMTLVAWIGLGLLAGVIARLLMPGRRLGGCAAVIVGVTGALLGGLLATLLDFGGLGGHLDWRNLVVATLSSIVLLALWRLIRG